MSGEPAEAEQQTVWPGGSGRDEERQRQARFAMIEATVKLQDEIMDLEERVLLRDPRERRLPPMPEQNDDPFGGECGGGVTPEQVALATATYIFGKAFLETMGKRAGDGLADIVQTRFRRNGKTTEAEIGLDGDQATRLIVKRDLPDEARLALLDLDVTALEFRGKELRWDSSAGEWRPYPSGSGTPDSGTGG